MKAQLPATPQASLPRLQAVVPAMAHRENSNAVKAAETLRPVAETGESRRTGVAAGPAAPPVRQQDVVSVPQSIELRFSVDEPSGRMVVSIVDRATSEVVRQIPAEEMLAIARQIEDKLRDAGTTEGLFVADEV